MKSYAVDSIYAFIIIVAVFLVLPFFVPMQEEEYLSEPVGEYSIEEEKPEIFTRIIDRVSSFYRLKKKKKAVLSESLREESSADKKELSSSEKSALKAEGQAAGSSARMSGETLRSQDLQTNGEGGRRGRNAASLPDMAELDGKRYPIMPDPYGNKYVIAKGGPIALKDFLAKGGRIVKPMYNYDAGNDFPGDIAGGNIGSGGNGGRVGAKGNASAQSYGELASYKTRGGGKISGFNQGKTADLNDEEYAANQGGTGGRKAGFDLSGYDFSSGESFNELRQNLSAKSGVGSKGDSAEERENRTPKVYKLQNTKPFVSENAVGVSIQNEEDGISLDIGEGGASEDSFGFDSGPGGEIGFEEQEPLDGKNVVSRSIEAGYENSLGIIPENADTRKAMTRELLGDSAFVGRSEQGRVSDPWILPNNIDNGPGKEFFEANRDVLLGSDAVSFREWEENDIYYDNVRGEIETATNGAVTPLVMINGQKGPFTMQVMPENSYYYKVTSNLLNNKVRNVDENGEVDLNRIDRNRVLVVVPERPLAENLRKDGYKVAIFEKYIVTPGNLKNFYDQTSSAVKDIEAGKKAEHEAKKQDIARSLKI